MARTPPSLGNFSYTALEITEGITEFYSVDCATLYNLVNKGNLVHNFS
jgi:hypothetical protein